MKKILIAAIVIGTIQCSCLSAKNVTTATMDSVQIHFDLDSRPTVQRRNPFLDYDTTALKLEDFYEDYVDLNSLPTAPRDYSLLESNTTAMKVGKNTMKAKNFENDYKTKYVALCDIPNDKIKIIYDIQQDNNIYVVTYWNGDTKHHCGPGICMGTHIHMLTSSPKYKEMSTPTTSEQKESAVNSSYVTFRPHNAIFNAEGKCIAKLEDDLGIPVLNTKKKEICFFNNERQIDVYDYNGKFLRRDTLKNSWNKHLYFTNGMPVGVTNHDLVLLDEEGMPQKVLLNVVIGNDGSILKSYKDKLYFISKAAKLDSSSSDTIWEITPEKIIARYQETTPNMQRKPIKQSGLFEYDETLIYYIKSIHPDALTQWYTPAQLKEEFYKTHEVENDQKDKVDEKFIKSLRLDANPVLVVTDMK